MEAYLTACDCGHDWSQQSASESPQFSSHTHDLKGNRRVRIWPWTLGVALLGLGGWHFACTEQVEEHIFQAVEPFLREQDDVTLSFSVHVQPLSNFVAIDFRFEADGADSMKPEERLLVETVVTYLRSQIEPIIERELGLVARKQFDLYAMALPYRSAVSVEFSDSIR